MMAGAAASRAREIPPPLELLCLRALWSLGEGSVHDVRRVTGTTKPLAYTTVMTLLERLVKKGALSRRKKGRAFIYAAEISCDSVRRLALKEFLESYFDGSRDHLLHFLEPAPAPLRVAENHLDVALL